METCKINCLLGQLVSHYFFGGKNWISLFLLGIGWQDCDINVTLKYIINIYPGFRTAVIINDMNDSTEQHNSHNMLSYLGYSEKAL